MVRRALILLLGSSLALASTFVQAQERAAAPTLNGSTFKDLPGVVPEKSRVTAGTDEDANGKCDTVIGYVRHYDRFDDDIFGRDYPTRLYRCESNGVTYTGTQMPNRPWVPGLNPHFLPEN